MAIKNLVPRDSSYDQLGTADERWSKLFVGDIDAVNIVADNANGVAIHGRDSDMLQSTYDPDGDGKVVAADSADTVPWSGITGKPNFADPAWKAPVANPASLPLTLNTIHDMRIVIDDGDGKGAMYECISITGGLAQQWSKMADVDWGGGEPAMGNPAADGYILSSSTLGVRSWILAASTVITGFNASASKAAVAATDTILAALGKLYAYVFDMWNETKTGQVLIPAGGTGFTVFAERDCTYTRLKVFCQDLAGAAQNPTGLVVTVKVNGTLAHTSGSITTAKPTAVTIDIDADKDDEVRIEVSNTTGLTGGVLVAVENERRVS